MEKYLFLCKAGMTRSPFCAHWFKEEARRANKDIETDYAGIHKYSPHRITSEQIIKVQLVFAMEEDYRRQLIEEFSTEPKKVINLDIQDIYCSDDGSFSSYSLEKRMEGLKPVNPGEVKRILEKEEIKLELSLPEILKRRNLFQYIQ